MSASPLAGFGCDILFTRILVRGWESVAVEVRCGSGTHLCEACRRRLRAAAQSAT
jgi:hypothetical protein